MLTKRQQKLAQIKCTFQRIHDDHHARFTARLERLEARVKKLESPPE